jgi:putative ABC transport system permease protein
MGTLRRAVRNITRRKTRALLVIAILSLALTMLIALPASVNANQQATQKAIDDLNAEAESFALSLSSVATEMEVYRPIAFDYGSEENNYTTTTILYPLMNLSDYTEISTIPNVKAVVPILRQDIKDPQNQNITLYDVYGIPLEASIVDSYPSVLPSNITAGRNLRAGDRGVVVLQEVVADQFGVGVDDKVNLLGQNFDVVGIQRQGAYQGLREYNVTAAFMSLEDAQRITNTTGQATALKIFVNASADNMVRDVYDAQTRITELYSANVSVQVADAVLRQAFEVRWRIDQQKTDMQNMMDQLQNAALIQIILAMVAQGAVILIIMLYTVRERTREIGTLKALGAGSKTILGQFMLEGVLLSFTAGIVSIAIGTIGISALGHILLPNLNPTGEALEVAAVTITPELALFGLGVAVLLGALGSLYPAWRAAKIRPAEAMRRE